MSLRFFLCKIHIAVRDIYDYFTAKEIMFPLADLLHTHGEILEVQFVVASRVADIERFLEGDNEFHFQNVISNALWGDRHNRSLGDERFAELIKSVMNNGYDNKRSILTVDCNYSIVDGTHRAAMALVAGVPYVRAKVVRWKSYHPHNIDWFLNPLIPSEDLEGIKAAYIRLQKKLCSAGFSFSCLIKGVGKDMAQNVENDLRVISEVVGISELSSGSIKIGFLLSNPQFYIKDNQVISKRVENIERLINTRYPDLSGKIRFAYNSAQGAELS